MSWCMLVDFIGYGTYFPNYIGYAFLPQQMPFFLIGKEKKGKNVLEVLFTFYLVFYLHYLIISIFLCLDHEVFGCYIFMVTCMIF